MAAQGPKDRPLSEVTFLTVAEVAAVMRVSKMTVYRLVHAGTLPAVRVGRSFRVPGAGRPRLPRPRLRRDRLTARPVRLHHDEAPAHPPAVGVSGGGLVPGAGGYPASVAVRVNGTFAPV